MAKGRLALQFQFAKRPSYSHRWKPKTDEELAVEEAQYITMRKMNNRGRIPYGMA